MPSEEEPDEDRTMAGASNGTRRRPPSKNIINEKMWHAVCHD